MSIVNVGTPQSGTGDTLYTAFSKVNAELARLDSELTGIGYDVDNVGFRNPYTIFVAADGNDSNNGHSYGEPVLTVNRAIELANAIIDSDSAGTRVLISVSPGNYVLTDNPVRIRHHVSIMGDALRSVVFRPAPGRERDGFFKVDDAFYCWGLTFKGHQADSEKVGWVFQFDDEADNTARGATGLGAYITASPYCQNCSSITAEDDEGFAPSRSEGDTGGGFLIDREHCAPNTPIASFVVDSFTQVNLDGIGCLVRNDAYAQLVSFFGTFCRYHVLTETGGQVNFTGGTSDFGTYGLVADGYSKTPLYTAQAQRDHYGVRRSELDFTVTSSTTLTFVAHGLINGAPVTVKTATQFGLPTTLEPSTIYYVVQKTVDTIKLAEEVGGTPLVVNGATTAITVINQGELAVYCDNFTANRVGTASRPGNGQLMFTQLVFPRTGSLAADDETPGEVNSIEQTGELRTAVAVLDTAPALAGKHDYVLNSGTVTVTRVGIFVDPEGNTITTVPVAGLNTYTFPVTYCDYDHLTGITKFRAQDYIPSALDSFYFTDCKFVCPLSAYIVTSAEPINQFGQVVAENSPAAVGYKVNVYNATNGGLIYPIPEDATLDFRRFSYISAPSHVFEYVGSGTNYSALPENGGVPRQANAYQEINGGRVFISWTNEKGDFGVSNRFLVDGTTGEVTISASNFNLSGLNQIGPFSRNGGLSTVGVVLKEVSDNRNMVSSLGISDANTVPTQTAVIDYITEALELSLPNGTIVNDTAFYFSSQEPYPTIRIDDTAVKAGDVLWAKSLHRWLYYDGSTWTDTETDGTVKGGVAHFVRNTKPTVRNATPSNPTPPLVAGDRWYKKDDATEWFWNGTYWLSSMIYRLGSPVGASNLGVQVNTGSYLTRSYLDMPATVEISYVAPLFFTEWVVELRSIGPVHDSTNYYSVEPGILSSGASTTLPFGVDTRGIGGGGRVYKVPLNNYIPQSIYGSVGIQRLWVQGFGTAPGFRIFSTLNYRLVA